MHSSAEYNLDQFKIFFVEYYLKKYVKEGDKIMDIGCGRSQYRNSTSGIYTGLDITDEPYTPDSPRNVDIVAEATNIPEPDNSYNLVFSVGAFFLIPEPEQALAEFKRVLKPNGRLILFDYNSRTQKRLQRIEGVPRPCWSQWQLKGLVEKAGFQKTELLIARNFEVNRIIKFLGLLYQEYLGQWAIVTGVK